MSKFITFKPIGETLQEAGLITNPQLEVALRDQAYYEDMRLGEILALRGWIKQNTADFFVQEWHRLINGRREHPIGFYFQRAGLLTEEDIETILIEQHQLSLRFGDTAIKKGLVKPNTVNFFIQNLFPSQSNYQRRMKQKKQIEEEGKISREDITYWVNLSTETVSEF